MSLALARCLEDPQALWMELKDHWEHGDQVGLALPQEREALIAAVCGGGADAAGSRQPPLEGPALVVGSGGSSGGRRWCLQPLEHLERSADACGQWLRAEGIDPSACVHLAALPLHHISGLMPLMRATRWNADLRWLPPAWMRQGEQLADLCPLPTERPVLLSLVPTQLQRLMQSPATLAWLAGCRVIWVGGAPLGDDLARRARDAGLALAPCYGATETAAMVCALPPRRFLAGERGCGSPLSDVELRLEGAEGAIAVCTPRLSPGWFAAGQRHTFADGDGWWRSGDAGAWVAAPRPGSSSASDSAAADPASLLIRGRLDGAIHSGGETVFPEQLELRLLQRAKEAGLPLEAVLLLGVADPLWGERLVALVRPGADVDPEPLLAELRQIAACWQAAERPCQWRLCPTLAPQANGKWERGMWRAWLERRSASITDPRLEP